MRLRAAMATATATAGMPLTGTVSLAAATDFEPGARALPALRPRASEAHAAPRPSRRRLTALAPQVALGGALSLESYGCSLRLSFKKRVSVRKCHGKCDHFQICCMAKV